MSEPTLNGSSASALKLGIQLLPPGELRDTANEKWHELLAQAKEGSLRTLVKKAWNLPSNAPSEPSRQQDDWDEACIDAHEIDVLPLRRKRPGVDEEPTETSQLLEEKFENNPS